jgi:hypothetical protein
VGGLPWLNPAEFREVKPDGPKQKKKQKKNKIYFYFYFYFGLSLLGAGGPTALRRVACGKKKKNFFWPPAPSWRPRGVPCGATWEGKEFLFLFFNF